MVNFTRSGLWCGVLSESSQDNQSVIVTPDGSILTLALQSAAPTAEFLLTADLAAGLPQSPRP